MTKRLVMLALVVLSGCAHKLADLAKPTSQRSFVLDKDHARVEKRGIGYTWVEGLRAGTYTLAAEDEDGLYFMGEGDCVLRMTGDAAQKYLEKGEVTAGVHGGLWLPRSGVDKDPKLWYLLRYAPEDRAAAIQGGGLIGAWATASSDGDVLFIGYGSEKEFVSQLRIVSTAARAGP